MPTLSTTPDSLVRHAVLGNFAAPDFARRPTFQNVAALCFKQALLEKYPALSVDFTQLAIAEPVESTDSSGPPRGYRFGHPVDAMIRSFINSTPVTLIQGVHRLTVDPNRLAPHPLAVGMAELQAIINDHAPLLIRAYQQALAEFWSDSPDRSLPPLQWLRRCCRRR